MLKYLCLGFIVGLTSAAVIFKDCGHREIKYFQISDTINNTNIEYTLTVEFVAQSKKADIQITTDAGVERINGCDALLMCPLKSNETSRLEYKMSSKMTAKIINDGVRVNITGEHDTIACGFIHGTIISGAI